MPSKTPPVPLEAIRRRVKNKLRIFSRALPFRPHAGRRPFVKIFGEESLGVLDVASNASPGVADTRPCVSEGSSLCPNWRTTRAKAGAFAYARTRQNNAILIRNGRSRTRRIVGKTLGSRRRAKSLG